MAKRTVLITGGAGMLACDLFAHFGALQNYQVAILPKECLDVTRSEKVEDVFEKHKPDVVINTAAIHVDDSETSPERAFAVNGWACRSLARACDRRGAVMVQISTGGLFGDEVRPYHEYDSPELKTVYARSKYAGEAYVQSLCRRYFILRLGWLYGGSVEHKKNFVVNRYREALQKPALRSAADKYGSPTYTGDAARITGLLLESEQYGLYHVANQGGCSRASYVRLILKEFGLSTEIEEVDSSYFPRRARVPDCEILTSLNLSYAGLPSLPPWQEALTRYIHCIREEVK